MTPNTPNAGTNDGKPSAVTREQAIAIAETWLAKAPCDDFEFARRVYVADINAILAHLRTPAPVLGEAERELARARDALQSLVHTPAVIDALNPSGYPHFGKCQCPWCEANNYLASAQPKGMTERQYLGLDPADSARAKEKL